LVLIAALGVAGCAHPPLPPVIVPKLQPWSSNGLANRQEPPQYTELTAERCQYLAAEFAPKAARRQIDVLIAADMACDRQAFHQEFGAMQRDLLAFQTEGERNLAAGQALEAFYALLEAEQDTLRTQPSLQEIAAMERFVSEAKHRGVALPSDTSILARLKLDASQRNAEAELLCRQWNDRLKLMLGWDIADKHRIRPSCDASVSQGAIDVEEAIKCGLANRSDLLQLRVLAQGITPGTLPLARAFIGQADGMTAASPPGLGEMKSQRDLHLRREQLMHLLAQRELAATVEITEAAAAIETHAREAAMAQEKLDSWRKRLAELEQQQAAGRATKLDTGLVRLEVVGAERALFHEVIAYKTAQVKLAAAQGILAKGVTPGSLGEKRR